MTDAEFMLDSVERRRNYLKEQKVPQAVRGFLLTTNKEETAIRDALKALAEMPCICHITRIECKPCKALRKFRAAMEGE